MLSETIGAIYEAALSPERWREAMDRLRDHFDLSFAASLIDNEATRDAKGWVSGIDNATYEQFLSTLFVSSPFQHTQPKWQPGQITPGVELIPQHQFRRTRQYADWCRVHDLEWGLRIALTRDSAGNRHAVNLWRPRSRDPFGAREIALASMLMPHLQRASYLSRRLGELDVLGAGGLAALDLVQHAIFLVDHDARVAHANTVAEALLAADKGLSTSVGALVGGTPQSTAKLQKAIADAACRRGEAPRGSALRLPRSSGRAMVAVVLPLAAEPAWSFGRRPLAVLWVTDPDSGLVVRGRELIALFGVTGAEAAVATALLAGKTLQQVAVETQRSLTTIKSQLSGLMAKLGVNRQSELVRVLASLPRSDSGV
jgi:DNA-binding CsgD family transcriptional regulator